MRVSYNINNIENAFLIIEVLSNEGYKGWFVVEAEQDPAMPIHSNML